MKKLNLNINYDFNNVLNNVINSTIKPFYEIFYLDKIYYFSKLEYLCFIASILFTILIFIRRLKKIDYQNDSKIIENKNYIKLIFVSILLYYSSISPLFLHYLSPRHFYIPMFFFMIGLSFFLTIINKLNIFKKKKYKILIFLYLILFTNTFIKFENNKYNQINNFNLKEDFYKNIKEDFKNYTKIYLINFPVLFNDYNLFAHESYSMRFILNEKNLPMIHIIEKQKIEEMGKDEGLIEFVDISGGKINYKIYK